MGADEKGCETTGRPKQTPSSAEITVSLEPPSGTGVVQRLQLPEEHRLCVPVSEFVAEAIGGTREDVAQTVAGAISFYLAEKAGGHEGWRFPEFLAGKSSPPAFDVWIGLSGGTWRRFSQEAERQNVAPEELARHALFYLLAERSDLDAGSEG